MPDALVDSNVLLDILTNDPTWFDWSSETLANQAQRHTLFINIVVYAEISVAFARIEEVNAALKAADIHVRTVPNEAAFLAGKCFLRYRRAGGAKTSPLPDFFIGAQAATEKSTLITRDANRYRTYFPSVSIVAPP